MEEENNNLLNDIVKSVVRKLLILIFGAVVTPLVAHGWLTQAIASTIQSQIAQWATIIAATILLFLYPLLWGALDKIVQRARVAIALATDPKTGATPKTVEQALKALPEIQKLKLGTSPGTVPVPTAPPPDKG